MRKGGASTGSGGGLPHERLARSRHHDRLADCCGSDKEQFIHTSAASTILLPLIVSAFAVYVFKQAWRALQSARKRSDS